MEKPIDTAIRYLEWHYTNEFNEKKETGMKTADYYNLKRFVEQLKEFRGDK